MKTLASTPVTALMGDSWARDHTYRFHWLQFISVYWLVSGAVAVWFSNVWVFAGCWLATPLALAGTWFLKEALRKRRFRRTKGVDVARSTY